MKVNIYIKCYFVGNPWGAGVASSIVEYIDKDGKAHCRKSHIIEDNDTKNSLILKMCIKSLKILRKPCEVTISIDCDYIKNANNSGWLQKWHDNNWKRAKGMPLANIGEWKQFYMLMKIHKIYIVVYGAKYDQELEEIIKEGKRNQVHGFKK